MPCYCDNLTVSTSFRVSLLFSWLRLFEDKAICAQAKAFAYRNTPTVTKKLQVLDLILNTVGDKRSRPPHMKSIFYNDHDL